MWKLINLHPLSQPTVKPKNVLKTPRRIVSSFIHVAFNCCIRKKKQQPGTARSPIKFTEYHKNIHPIELGNSFHIRSHFDVFSIRKTSIHALISFICAELHVVDVFALFVWLAIWCGTNCFYSVPFRFDEKHIQET